MCYSVLFSAVKMRDAIGFGSFSELSFSEYDVKRSIICIDLKNFDLSGRHCLRSARLDDNMNILALLNDHNCRTKNNLLIL